MRRLLAVCAMALLTPLAAAQSDMPAADPLHATPLFDLDDKPADFARFKGKPLVVNFWARWCGPCRVEIPELVAARARHKGRVEVVGLALEEKAESVRDFAKAYDIDYPVLLTKDKGIPLMQALGNAKAGLPYTLALDKAGRVVYKKLGGMKEADVEAAFTAALGKH